MLEKLHRTTLADDIFKWFFCAGVLRVNTYLGAGWPAGTILGSAPMALTAPVIATGGTEGLTTGIWGLEYTVKSYLTSKLIELSKNTMESAVAEW